MMELAIDQNLKKKKSLKIGYWLEILFPWLVFAVAMAILFLGWQLVIKGQYERFNSDLSLIKSLDAQISGLNVKIKSTGGEFDSSLKFNKTEEDLLSYAMPDSPDFPSALIQLDGLARKNGFIASSIKMDSSAEVPGIKTDSRMKKINLNFEVIGGNYDNFKNLLLALEKSIMPFNVLSVAFGGKQNGTEGYSLKLVSYYYPKN